LTALADDPAIHQGVVTGNLRAVARVKLEAFDLARFLDLDASAYGDDHRVRAELVVIARQRATERTGTTFGPVSTIVIGDTPRDVEAGRTAGARVVAVASGRSDVNELRDAGAVDVLPDLTDVGELRRLVSGTP
jgi:phosphoglycolate phosphatase-like HAD superfamily hydrolase